ncbi:MAG: DUF4402 domain-containing protein [Bacteroidales bacterium]|jgi:hypothetical protein|nr:DUF4402 domain-containing protein [Bacteroidales bacterium]
MKGAILSFLLSVTLFLTGSLMIYGQSGTKYVPLTAQLEIEVIVPLSISKEANLSFGFASPGNGAGYVTILPAENPQRTASGVATLLPSGSGIVSAAKFRVTGAPGAQVNISVPDYTFPLYHQGGTTSVNLNLTGSSNSLQLGPAGDGVFYVGGTVTMWWGQSLGVYSGTFNVTVCNN